MHPLALGLCDESGGREKTTVAWQGRIRARIARAKRVAGEMIYGATAFDWVRGVRRQRSEVEHLFVLVTFGDLVGLPLLPPYYALRLLPYVVPKLNQWKRNLLRERDWSDLADLIEGVD